MVRPETVRLGIWSPLRGKTNKFAYFTDTRFIATATAMLRGNQHRRRTDTGPIWLASHISWLCPLTDVQPGSALRFSPLSDNFGHASVRSRTLVLPPVSTLPRILPQTLPPNQRAPPYWSP